MQAADLVALHMEIKMSELRIPHILWVALFWSIVMMFVAENLIP